MLTLRPCDGTPPALRARPRRLPAPSRLRRGTSLHAGSDFSRRLCGAVRFPRGERGAHCWAGRSSRGFRSHPTAVAPATGCLAAAHDVKSNGPWQAATNVCFESTARDAMMLNYKVFFVSDANACRTDEEHNATLAILMIMFADVRSTDEMIALLQRHAAPVAGAAE